MNIASGAIGAAFALGFALGVMLGANVAQGTGS